jgi:thymidylate synthase
MHIEAESLRTGYAEIGAQILTFGHETSPRGEKTVEILGASLTLHDPADSLPVGTGRGVVKQLAATETLQLIGGFHDPEALVAAAPHFANYLDADGRQRAPYGPRLAAQLPVAIERIKSDPDSRQAQVVVWDPALDNEPGLHDYPCTTSIQLLVREGGLHMQVHMRSNDFWLGLPYDVFMFTQLQLAVTNVLGLEPGVYRHSAASLHIYEKHLDKADELREPTAERLPTYGICAATWDKAVERAQALHDDGEHAADLSTGERWLHMAMASVNRH